jgi:hypothetical protein
MKRKYTAIIYSPLSELVQECYVDVASSFALVKNVFLCPIFLTPSSASSSLVSSNRCSPRISFSRNWGQCSPSPIASSHWQTSLTSHSITGFSMWIAVAGTCAWVFVASGVGGCSVSGSLIWAGNKHTSTTTSGCFICTQVVYYKWFSDSMLGCIVCYDNI